MAASAEPSISAVVAAYQAEEWIGEALDAILGQTRPPDEVVVVNDGSTDGTGRELERYGRRIRVVHRPNGGCPAAFNTAFREARGDFVAMCGADDIWEPRKLEWQLEAIRRHPQADVLFGHARMFGRIESEHARPPHTGLLDSDSFRNALFAANCVCAPSVVIRRSLFESLGPFVEKFGADDYEYWFRCLRAGARFYYDERPLLRYRQHDTNLSAQMGWMDDCTCQVRRWYEADVSDRRVVDAGLAPLLFRIARRKVDEGATEQARGAFRESLGHARGLGPSDSARALAWIAILSLPNRVREQAGGRLVTLSRGFDDLLGIRQGAPS